MTDILIQGVPSIKLSGKPKASSKAYALAGAICYSFPYQYDVEALAEALQATYGTAGDISTDAMFAALTHYNVKFILEDALVAAGNVDDMRHEIGAQEKQGNIHIVVVNSDAPLAIAVPLATPDPTTGAVAVDGEKLHPWSKGVEYALLRVGFSDSSPWGYYKDPILSSLPYADFGDPTPVLWQTVANCGIASIIGILPSTVAEAPPADFRYYGGGNGQPDNTWPVAVDSTASTVAAVQALQARLTSELTAEVTTLQAQLSAILPRQTLTFEQALFGISNGKVGNA